MPLSTIADAIVRRAGSLVRLNISGKSFEFRPDDALELSNRIANTAADLLPIDAALPEISGLMLKPYGNDGSALLRIVAGNMPLTVKVSHQYLNALSEAANAALEHSEPAGSS